MKAVWVRLALGVVAVATAVTIVAGGSAGPRAAIATFAAFPGPGQVTYDELIAYRATFENTSGSSLTHVRFRQSVPVVGTVAATFVTSTCPTTPTTVSTPTGPEWVCSFGQVPAGSPELKLTIVWRAPILTGDVDGCVGCLVSTGRWSVKEGINDPGDPNDTFGKTTTFATMLAGDGGQETLVAGGYEMASTSCGTAGDGNLHTLPVISVPGNPISTTFCLPAGAFTLIPSGSPDLGYATTIAETAGNARHTEVCIAALGTNCGPGYVDQNFFVIGSVVTVVIQVADAAIQTPAPGRETITSVSHNGVPMTAATCAATGDCIVSINLNNQTKIWTIVVTSGTNGSYDF
jgi:hypothetical protein